MTVRDFSWRGAGLALVCGALGLKALFELGTQQTGLPSDLLTVLGFSSFFIACFGVVLMIGGAELRERWVAAIREDVAQSSTPRTSKRRPRQPPAARDPKRRR